jgi:hypothetical protein
MATPRELFRLLDRLGEGTDSTVTSTRLPTMLYDAVRLAVELGMDTSANDATNQALRDRVEVFAQQLALEEHYRKHPTVRPTLAEVALAAALLDGDPLAERPDLLEQAAAEVAERWPDATGDDVLVYAAALARHQQPPHPRRPAA